MWAISPPREPGLVAVHAAGGAWKSCGVANIPVAGATIAVVIGRRSDIVGKPVAMLLINANATVTVLPFEDEKTCPRLCRNGGHPGKRRSDAQAFVIPEFVKGRSDGD